METGIGVLDTVHSTAENNPAGDDDEQEQDDFDDTDGVHAAHAPVGEEDVDEGYEADHCDCNASLFPFGRFLSRCEDHVGYEDDASLGWASQYWPCL